MQIITVQIMADDKKAEETVEVQVKAIAEGVKGIKEKTAKIDALEAKLAEKETEIKALSDWKVTKEADDVKNQEALNTLIAKSKETKVTGKKDVSLIIAEGVKENYDAIKSLKKGQTVGFDIDMKAVADMTFSANFSTADASVTEVKPGIVALPNRKVHMRQLLSLGGLGKSNFDFVREKSTGEGDVTTVAEGAQKPQFDIDLEEASAPSEYIAGFVVISRKMLDDVDSMTSFLQMRLMQRYLKVEDTQVLTGNGTSPNLSGLITNATAATTVATNNYDQILDGLGQLEGTDYEATGILINPATYYKIAESKASTSGIYNQPGIVAFINGQLYFDGIPVYKSTAIAKKSYLIGDFQSGAQLLIRENPRVEFFEQDNTNVRFNKITVRVEGRVALPIYYTGAFVTGTFATY